MPTEDMNAAQWTRTTSGELSKIPYKTPLLICNGKLAKVTLQYTFGADGVCAPGGQGVDDRAANFDPDCT